ncbi:MAG: FAD:protein FMN transferase [Acidobacteriaceae bacterium]
MSCALLLNQRRNRPSSRLLADDCKACPVNSPQLYSFTHPAMGTEFTLYLYSLSREDAVSSAQTVFEEVDRIEGLLSHYRVSSELSRINREASFCDVTTDPETLRFLATAFEWSSRSDGAFDITVGKLMKTWGFFGASGRIPTHEELTQVRDQVGWHRVRLDSKNRTVRFLTPGVELDPGGIGKGYAVDRAIRILQEQPTMAALISAGSSTIYGMGAPPGEEGWRVQVPAPGSKELILSTVILRDTSLSTANHTEKYFIDKGHFYGSIMNPNTLHPVESVLHVTVISPSATDSDALSNALFVLDSEHRASLLDQLPTVSTLVLLGNHGTPQCEATRWPARVSIAPDPSQINAKDI